MNDFNIPLLAGAAESGIVTNGLVMYFNARNPKCFTPDNRNNCRDLSGHGYSASLSSGVIYQQTGSIGGFVFHGADYIQCSYSQSSWTTSSNLTWNVWVYSRAVGQSQHILGNRYNPGVKFFKLTTSAMEYNNVSNCIITYNMPNSVWHNNCIVKNEVSFSYYRDGVLGASGSNPSNMNTTNSFYIGGDPQAGEYSSATIGLVSIYHRALSENEVKQNFSASKQQFRR